MCIVVCMIHIFFCLIGNYISANKLKEKVPFIQNNQKYACVYKKTTILNNELVDKRNFECYSHKKPSQNFGKITNRNQKKGEIYEFIRASCKSLK